MWPTTIAVRVDDDQLAESVFLNRPGHRCDGAVVLSWVALEGRDVTDRQQFDVHVIDAILIDSWASITRALAEVQNFIDTFFIDGAVDGIGVITQEAGWKLRTVVTGQLQQYLLYISLAVGVFSIFIFTR